MTAFRVMVLLIVLVFGAIVHDALERFEDGSARLGLGACALTLPAYDSPGDAPALVCKP